MATRIVYWQVKARGWPAYVAARFAGLKDVEFDSATANAWPAAKDRAPFGQLPILETPDGHTYAQSGALYRIIARKAKLEGETDHEFALNNMLIEEYQDIYGTIVKNVYIKDDAERAAGWEATLTKAVPQQLAYLERLIGANGQFSPNRLLIGDVLILCSLNVLLSVEGKILDSFPKLKAFYDKNQKAVLSETDGWTQYVVRK